MTKALLFAFIAILCIRISCRAQPGALDTSFGREGKVLMDINSTNNIATKVLLQPDGKTIIVGYSTPTQGEEYFSMMRFTSDGIIDETFGLGGIVETHFTYGYAGALSAVLQGDGKILVAGYISNGWTLNFVLMRYTSDGDRDVAFGEDGVVTTDFSNLHDSYDKGNDVLIQSDGKILVCGSTYNVNNLEMDAALARYDQNGVLDLGFGVDGLVRINIGEFGLWQSFRSVATTLDGKIVAGGFTEYHDEVTDTYNNVFMLIRFHGDGTKDESFGVDGIVQTLIGKNAIGNSVVLQTDGRILFAGSAKMTNGGYDDLVITRYHPNGSLDLTFGNNGFVLTSLNNTDDVANDIALQSDGKIIVAGFTAIGNGTTLDFALARFHNDGTIDNTFGFGGKVTTDFANDWDFGTSVAIQKNGKIVVTGYAKFEEKYDFAVARYLNDATLPVTLTHFSLVNEDKFVRLNWRTSFESNSSRFEIQRSNDGKHWFSIGSVNANHESDVIVNYTFLDCNPTKKNFYRLKMVDTDSTFAYSLVKTSMLGGSDLDPTLVIFPNPVSETLNLKISNDKQIAQIAISDFAGRQTLLSITDRDAINVKWFRDGLYLLTVTYKDGKSESRKIAIQH